MIMSIRIGSSLSFFCFLAYAPSFNCFSLSLFFFNIPYRYERKRVEHRVVLEQDAAFAALLISSNAGF